MAKLPDLCEIGINIKYNPNITKYNTTKLQYQHKSYYKMHTCIKHSDIVSFAHGHSKNTKGGRIINRILL